MTSYTAEEIRRAFLDARGNYGVRDVDTLLAELRKAKASPAFADSETITVKELRDAYANVGDIFNDDSLLAWIREHREPDYPHGTVWKDTGGVIWFRTSDKMWYRFGSTVKFADERPRRPLRQMKEA